jgi:hypothetical protein
LEATSIASCVEPLEGILVEAPSQSFHEGAHLQIVRKRRPMSFHGCSATTSLPVSVSSIDFATVSVMAGKEVKPP